MPNQIGIKTGVGTNNLIKIGAKLITNSNELLVGIGEKPIIEETKEKKEGSRKTVEKEYLPLYQVLEKGPINSNELAKEIGESIAEVNQKLTMMEIEGLIETLPGNIVKRKE